MNTNIPKIWAIPVSVMQVRGPFVRKIGLHLRDNTIANRAAVETRVGYPDGLPLPIELAPDHIFFNYFDLTEAYRAESSDWFGIASVMSVISDPFRNLLLSRFDTGANELFEVPLCEYDQVTPRPGRWYILHIRQTKDTLIPEGSTGLEPRGRTPGKWRLRSADGGLTVRRSAAAGADIWIDLNLLDAILVSDRLKVALAAAAAAQHWRLQHFWVVSTRRSCTLSQVTDEGQI